MIWWIWLLLGLALLGAEILTPGGFYLFFFGCGAVAVGVVTSMVGDLPDWGQWLLFSGLSVVSLLIFRKPLLEKVRAVSPPAEVDSLVGESAQACAEIAAGGSGKVELRGTTWNARNTGAAVAAGQRCRVERVDGLTLWIKGE